MAWAFNPRQYPFAIPSSPILLTLNGFSPFSFWFLKENEVKKKHFAGILSYIRFHFDLHMQVNR
jgi:hypothetical protein